MILSESTGIVLNDEMDDFSVPNKSNAFNLPPSKNNFVQPFKRPLSSMAPTIVTKNSDFFMTMGGSGGSTIITKVLEVKKMRKKIFLRKRFFWMWLSLGMI